jgi:glycosyltransferase involved in cell wall biosynthesis
LNSTYKSNDGISVEPKGKQTSLVSLVIPFFNEQHAIEPLFSRLDIVLSGLPNYAFEIVCINDGSEDQTLDVLLEVASKRTEAVIIDLSRNFGKEAALSSGLAVCSGDAVIPLDADLQDPPELIGEMLAKWEAGYEVVLAKRHDRSTDSLSKRATARMFYKVHNLVSDVTLPEDVGDFRLMDRAVVEALKLLPENRRFMKGLFAWVGFRTATIEFRREPRAVGRSSFNAWRLWNLALEGVTSFSTSPLKIWTYMGLAVAGVALVYGMWIVLRTLLFGIDVPGYASILVAILFLGGLQLIGIGVIGEYLGRTYLESKRRPSYVIRKIYRNDR